MLSGTYVIINLINSKVYIGSSMNLKKRKLRQFQALRKNRHHCKPLQNDYDKYGVNPFLFIELEHCENYKEQEKVFLKKLDYNVCYNRSRKASGGFMIANHPEKERLLAEAAERLKNAPKPEPRFGKDNPNWRGGISVSYCSCGNKKNLLAVTCTDCRDRTSVNNPFYGKKHSEEFKIYMSDLKKGQYHGPQEKSVSINGFVFKSLSEASRNLSMNASTILFRIRSSNPKFSSYFYN
jgi:group I intron endonuclease